MAVLAGRADDLGAGLGGLALSLLLGYWWGFANSYWGQELITGGFCVATALLIGFFSRGRDVTVDSAIGIFLVASVSIGVVMLFARRMMPGPNPMPLNPEAVLFGSINSVGATDAWLIGGVALRIGDRLYDGSVAAQLRRLKRMIARRIEDMP